MTQLTPEKIEIYKQQLRTLSNNAECEKAYRLAKKLTQKYPDVLFFAYYEAVMTAEDDLNYSPKEVERRFKLAAKKMKILIKRSRFETPQFQESIQNEYFWFSKQPKKQYEYGIKTAKKNAHPRARRGGYYSQGVGTAQLAKNYALNGKKVLCLRWAKISEKAWSKFHKLDPSWSNSYGFLAAVLGYQDRLKECDIALAKCCKYANKPKNWNDAKLIKNEILLAHDCLYGKHET